MSEFEGDLGFEVFCVQGNPTPEEETAIMEALEDFLGRNRPAGVTHTAASLSAWTLSGRLSARRSGILDIRSSLGRSAWLASARLPWSGRAHQERLGRGDSR